MKGIFSLSVDRIGPYASQSSRLHVTYRNEGKMTMKMRLKLLMKAGQDC